MPVDITLSATRKLLCNCTPSLLKYYQSKISNKEKSPISNCYINQIEDCINKKCDQTVKEIKHEFTNKNDNDLNNKFSKRRV